MWKPILLILQVNSKNFDLTIFKPPLRALKSATFTLEGLHLVSFEMLSIDVYVL